MKWITCLLLIFSLPSFSQCLKADIVLLIDWSGSEKENSRFISKSISDFTESLTLGPSSMKLGIIPFNSDPILKWCVNISYDKDIISSVSDQMVNSYPSGATDYQSSFRLADALFKKSSVDRGENVVRIIILISDGEELGRYSESISKDMKEDGCIFWCIGTSSGPIMDQSRDHLIRISSGIDFYLEGDYKSLSNELVRLDLCP